ncbi:MAG: DUF2157 domain-containing protein [Candidatus Omnitrophota bacterium]
MKKEEIINQIKDSVKDKIITKKEIMEAYEAALEEKGKISISQHAKLSNILYYIGGIIIFLGIAIFIGQNWSYLNDISKISATLGAAVAAYIVGVLLSRYERLEPVAQAFFFISGLVAPLGLHVTFDLAGFELGEAGVQSIMAAILFITYIASFLLLKRTVFLIFSIIFGTWFYFSFLGYLIAGNVYFNTWRVFLYRMITVSLAYIFLGYFLSKKDKVSLERLSRWLYCMGILVFLGSALCLGGWSPRQNIFWELIFPGLALGIVFLSVTLKDQAFLVLGTFYLMIYILKITAEYFTNSLGWPLSLVLAGLALMIIGYFTFYLKKKYISS